MIIMDKRYIIPATVLVILGAIILFLPPKDNTKTELTADQLYLDIIESTRFISTDEIADMIIKRDPSIQLIDVRSAEEYAKYALPGALNIPLNEILDDKWEAYLDQEARTNVFYSNGSLRADQAWILCRRRGFVNNTIMVGGLNSWVEDILKPQKPADTEGEQEWEIYSFRVAASQYFLGGNQVQTSDVPTAAPVVKRKKKMVQGGC